MSASVEMPYFIRPSVNMEASSKKAAYEAALAGIRANLQGESNMIMKMATINSVLKSSLTYFYWVGFYCVHRGQLTVGPYQGTLGCLHIDFSRGVCGKAASSRETQIVKDVHALAQGTAHIACDPNSSSEIVVPVFNANKELIAVFDVDSTSIESFDEIDQHYLELILREQFETENLEMTYQL